MQITLFSNSASPDRPYLSHAFEAIRDRAGADPIAFVPFALSDRRGYFEKVKSSLSALGNDVLEVPLDRQAALGVLSNCRTVFIGGGNTFRLLKCLQDLQLIEELRDLIRNEVLCYLGSSAGTNVACPTIRTTNDMPIVYPSGSSALGLVPFQINPHFIDADPSSRHMGETREQRIYEFLEENDCSVIALREGAWLTIDSSDLKLGGENGGKLFKRGSDVSEISTHSKLDWLLQEAPKFDCGY